MALKLHLFPVAQHARNHWHNMTGISISAFSNRPFSLPYTFVHQQPQNKIRWHKASNHGHRLVHNLWFPHPPAYDVHNIRCSNCRYRKRNFHNTGTKRYSAQNNPSSRYRQIPGRFRPSRRPHRASLRHRAPRRSGSRWGRSVSGGCSYFKTTEFSGFKKGIANNRGDSSAVPA